jgi:cellulose synthase/poly-beta-1,6-N-acetylglucosamine synthase-like glycosyltransferase
LRNLESFLLIQGIGMTVLDWVLTAAGVSLLFPIGTLAIETLAALIPARIIHSQPGQTRPPTVVLIPAHNEELVLGSTLKQLLPELRTSDRVIVISDNSTDRTAEIAREFGVEVLERSSEIQRGKGYALAAGLDLIREDPPELVLVVDADCRFEPQTCSTLLNQVWTTQFPAQAVYLMVPAANTPKQQISGFAFLVKNYVRPRGLDRLGLPILLTGTGMAFPWNAIAKMSLGSGNIVEDMQLGIDLAIAGTPVRLCVDSKVLSEFPSDAAASLKQRKRWEHGHVRTIRTQVPRLIKAGLAQRRLGLIGLAAELMIPPLALLVLTWLVLTVMVLLWNSLAGSSFLPSQLFLGAGIVLFLTITLAWLRFGRQILSLRSLLLVPLYVAWKIPIYFGLIFSPQKIWNRTERSISE